MATMIERGTWVRCSDQLPPKGVPVMTRIDDGRGIRNETVLVRDGENGRLWFFPDYSMYVYYAPTHWKSLALDSANAI